MNIRRISKSLLTELEEIVLTILPFLLFIAFYINFEAGKANWSLWFSTNRILAFIFLIGVIVWLILKKYNKYYFIVWTAFALYFSLSFVFQGWTTRSYGHYGYDFWGHATNFLQGHGLPSLDEFNYPLYVFPNLNLFILFLSLLLFVALFNYLKIEVIKKIIFVICYYFVYCIFLFMQYMPKITSSENYESAFRLVVIINSILSGLIILLLIRSKKIISINILIITYFIINFVAINIYRIKDIYINKLYFVIGNSQFKEMLQIVMVYINYFLLFSNILYLIILIYGIELYNKSRKIKQNN